MDERPRYMRELGWNPQLLQPLTPPGSVEEENALADLDAARAQEERELTETQADRARRHARHWRRQTRRA